VSVGPKEISDSAIKRALRNHPTVEPAKQVSLREHVNLATLDH
jgi:hypothetical protein